MESLSRAVGSLFRRNRSSRNAESRADGSANELLNAAFRLHQSGRLADSVALYRQALSADPASDTAHNLLGTALCAQGKLGDGEACFRSALGINASNVQALNNLASAVKDRGDVAGAEPFYRRAVELHPGFAVAWNNLGLIRLLRGDRHEAELCFRRALDADAGSAEAHNNLGTVLRTRGKPAEAEAEFRAAIAADPALAEGWCGLGDVLPLRGLLDEAEACCRRALELRTGYLDATNNLATIAKMRRRLAVANAYCDDVLRVDPRHVGALNNLGSIASMQARHALAETIFRDALRIAPHDAVTKFNLATTLLMLGRYDEGFALYESRFEAFPRPLTTSPQLDGILRSRSRWRGEPLNGKRLLIWTEQGLGDCIMMLRYLQKLRERGVGSVTLLCPPELQRLGREMPAVELVVGLHRVDVAQLQFDIHCPMMSLPAIFGSRLDTIPSDVPYLNVPNSMVTAWRERFTDSRPNVGIVWAGDRNLQDDARRSIPLEQFEPLLAIDTLNFVSLQKGEAAAEWRKMRCDGGQWIDECNDFLDTAALVMNLDMVIAVDTAVAHLAGALGRPVFLLNRFGSEWRWGLEGRASRWYPSVRIFREPALGGWSAIMEQVGSELATATERCATSQARSTTRPIG